MSRMPEEFAGEFATWLKSAGLLDKITEEECVRLAQAFLQGAMWALKSDLPAASPGGSGT